MNADIEYTFEYFNSEVCVFRNLFGQKDFWEKDEEHRERAVKALAFIYFNVKVKNVEEDKQLKSIFKNTMDEYTRRGTMILTMLLRKL